MAETVDETSLAAWRAFLNAHAALIDLIERELAESGQVPLTWYDVLLALREAPHNTLRPHELADRMVLRRSTLTRLLDRLAAAHLLLREPSGSDRRGTNIVLTDAGREALRRAWPVYARGIRTHFAAHLSEAEARTIASALGRVNASVRDHDARES